MAEQTRQSRADLATSDVCSFDPFQLIRLLECAHRDAPRVGESILPSEDRVRFSQPPSLRFAPGSVAGVSVEGGRARVELHCFGLLGPNGPLPLHLTEYCHDRIRDFDDDTFSSFLDLLSSRFTALFYRAWAINRPTVWMDRPEDDRFAFYLRSLVGLGSSGLADAQAIPDQAIISLAGHFALLPRSAESVESIVGHWFGFPVLVEQAVAYWMEIPEGSRLHLAGGTDASALGVGTFLGECTLDAQHRFRLRLGPMTLADYERLLPGDEGSSQLAALVRMKVGMEYVWDAQLVLAEGEMPPTELGRSGRLGYTTWLAGDDRERDDLVIVHST
ncbi:MAG: type VI secretion system baseplate subunit TssG [Phycisphaerales bacterium]|nr:type VI secretion system baseplate subunit TssG [Phycisphaerales bacterium]